MWPIFLINYMIPKLTSKAALVCLFIAICIATQSKQGMIKNYLEKFTAQNKDAAMFLQKIKQFISFKDNPKPEKTSKTKLPLEHFKHKGHTMLKRLTNKSNNTGPKMSQLCEIAVEKYESKIKTTTKGRSLLAAANAF